MKRRIVVKFPACLWVPESESVPTRECSIEEFQEGGLIVGYGKILHKCAYHQGIDDSDLISVLKTEGLARSNARGSSPEDKVLLMHYTGRGPARRLVTQFLDRSDG